MTKHDFIKLSLSERVEFLWKSGEVIAEKVYYDCNITLFLLDSFYVEVFFDRVRNEMEGIAVQESNDILYAYIKELDLEELVGRLD